MSDDPLGPIGGPLAIALAIIKAWEWIKAALSKSNVEDRLNSIENRLTREETAQTYTNQILDEIKERVDQLVYFFKPDRREPEHSQPPRIVRREKPPSGPQGF